MARPRFVIVFICLAMSVVSIFATITSSVAFSASRTAKQDPSKKKISPSDAEKLRLAEEAADRFVRRWHETLDLNVLFDEMFTANSWYRRCNAYLIGDIDMFVRGSTSPDKRLATLDEATMRHGVFAFWNLAFWSDEYNLCFDDPKIESKPVNLPSDLRQALESGRDMYKEKMSPNVWVNNLIAVSKSAQPVFQKYLTSATFASRKYELNLKLQYEEHWKSRVLNGLDDWEIAESVKIYNVERGIFDLAFIEEDGHMKVLTFFYEL